MKLSTAAIMLVMTTVLIYLLIVSGRCELLSQENTIVIQTISTLNDRLVEIEKRLSIEVPKDKQITFRPR